MSWIPVFPLHFRRDQASLFTFLYTKCTGFPSYRNACNTVQLMRVTMEACKKFRSSFLLLTTFPQDRANFPTLHSLPLPRAIIILTYPVLDRPESSSTHSLIISSPFSSSSSVTTSGGAIRMTPVRLDLS